MPSRRAAHDLLRSLRDNVGKYQVEAVGRVDRTHVFRGEWNILLYRLKSLINTYLLGMPDFVFSTTASSFTNRFREQILSYDCKFTLD